MRVAVAIKQVPRSEDLTLGEDGRLVRDGVQLEMNPYCRRAVAKAVEIALATEGMCTIFTLGPPSAEAVLREAIAWGLAQGLSGRISGVHLCGKEFAGSDTLATARALVAGIALHGEFDVVLMGRNSVDADTGQVPPEVAELLGLPFMAAARSLVINAEVDISESITEQQASNSVFRKCYIANVRCEVDDGWREVRLLLPAVISVDERICAPAKMDSSCCANVDPTCIERLSVEELGKGPWGEQGSQTVVGRSRLTLVQRKRILCSGTPVEQAWRAAKLMGDWGILETIGSEGDGTNHDPLYNPRFVPINRLEVDEVTNAANVRRFDVPVVAIIYDVGCRELMYRVFRHAQVIAGGINGTVVCLSTRSKPGGQPGAREIADVFARWCRDVNPWAVLSPGTLFGREVASRMAARLGVGLIGDALELEIDSGRLICWKPAFGGRMLAAITSKSGIQIVTLSGAMPPVDRGMIDAWSSSCLSFEAEASRDLKIVAEERGDDVGRMLAARIVVALGQGVLPEDYAKVRRFAKLIGAEIGCTRKVSDRGWMSRSRQIGLTGHSVFPNLYILLGASGQFNHMVGSCGAGTILAVNRDAAAPVFDWADIGIAADYREILDPLCSALVTLGVVQ